MASLKGQLLIAAPTLLDPNFQRTVVLVAEHNDEGAMGLVLNRLSTFTIAEAAPDVQPVVDPDDPLLLGGPVQPEAIVVLVEFADHAEAGMLVLGDLGFPRPDTDFTRLAMAARRARVFAGYAGWGPGQLEGELERDDWIVEPARGDEAFAPDADELWGTVLARKGGQYALVARMPVDPSVN